MRALHIVPDFSARWGGVYQSVRGLALALRNKIEISILETFRGSREQEESLPGVRQIRLNAGWKYQFSWDVKKTIEKIIANYDLIHIHGLWQFPLSYGAACARKFGVPYVYHVHGMLNPWPLRHHFGRKAVYSFLWERRNLNCASTVICVSSNEEKSVRQFQITSPTVVIPNGIHREAAEKQAAQGEFRAKHPALAQKTIILFLGRIHPKKGIDLLLSSFSTFSSTLPQAHLVIAGPEEDKSYFKKLQAFVFTHSLTERVTFLGPVYDAEKKALLADSNLFVLSSHDEGSSIAVLEAMASALPVVVTRECSFDEIEKAEAGLVVPYHQTALAEAMKQLLTDEWLAKRMGINGRNLVLSKYHWDAIGHEVVRLYESILAKAKRSQS